MESSPLNCTCGWTPGMSRGHPSRCSYHTTPFNPAYIKEIMQMTPEGPTEVKARLTAAQENKLYAPPGRMNDSERLGYDAVNLPDHYKLFKIEPIHFCQENNLDALQTAIVKYVVRYKHKNGIEDLKKAMRCLDMLISHVQGDDDWWTMRSSDRTRR